MFRIDYRSPEWMEVKRMLEQEFKDALSALVSTGKTEQEYHQWRGRAALANKLLELERHQMQVTDKGE